MSKFINRLKSIPGPILICGAGGFIGARSLSQLTKHRQDVVGVCRKKDNWRFTLANISPDCLRVADLTDIAQLTSVLQEIQPQTIWNFTAYGAYSDQQEESRIFTTNIVTVSNLFLASMQMTTFPVVVNAGSSSEYGLNCTAPQESAILIPNSAYAVSKIANAYQIVMYGKHLRKPCYHARLYSVYGPLEEPKRLVPTLLQGARLGKLPDLVDEHTTRDFIYVDDVIDAFIQITLRSAPHLYGDVINIGTGTMTTLGELVRRVIQLEHLSVIPQFGSRQGKAWDTPNWHANPTRMKNQYAWQSTTSLERGLAATLDWQRSVSYDVHHPFTPRL